MTLRTLLISVLLASLLGCVTWGNVAPTMEDQYVTAVQDTSVTFTVSAQDGDIDPADLGGHPLRFIILDGPTNGLLIGDLTEVQYAGPHDASVEMTYVPARGFVGIDYITIAVMDPFDETASGTMTIQIDVEQQRLEGLLSGSWDTSFTFDVQTLGFTAFRTQLTEVYRIGKFVAKGIAVWKLDPGSTGGVLFDSMRFQADAPFGDTFKVSSSLAFDPEATPLFDYWRTTTSFSILDTSFTHTFYVTDPTTNSYQTILIRGSVSDVAYSNTTTFDVVDGCAFCFGSDRVSLSWTWCDLQVRSTLSITDAGFQRFTLSASNVPIPGLVTPNFGVYMNLSLAFTATSKTFTPTLSLRTSWIDCVRVLAALETSGAANTSIDGFSIYGFKIRQALPGGTRVQIATSFDSTKNSSVTGQTDYFELLMISGTLESCCGAPGTWSVATYFNEDSPMLFDWGMSVIRATAVISDRFNFSFETVFRSGFFDDPKLELSVGWVARW